MIELKQVRSGYYGEEIIHGVDLVLERGEIVSFVGPNGCGKTTLLKSLCGLLPLTGGEVRLDGKELGRYERKELARKVAFLPQVRDIPSIGVESFVAHGRYPHLSFGRNLSGKDREKIEWAMEETGTADLRRKELSALSGGERQRVYLAMTLCQDTDILLLDEPTTYLDIGQKYEMMERVRKIHGMGKTVVMVLHDLSFAFAYSHRVAVMERGRLLAFGTPEETAEKAAELFGVAAARVRLGKEEEYVFYRGKKL